MFQSQTRRLLPRNYKERRYHIDLVRFNRRRDACFPATCHLSCTLRRIHGFNRRRDACFPATPEVGAMRHRGEWEFQSQTRRLLPRNLSSSSGKSASMVCFNRRRDACFPATMHKERDEQAIIVSIADATLASPQHGAHCFSGRSLCCFNRRRDACFPATTMT